MEYIYNPVVALKNIERLLRTGGKLYISTHFIYPHHNGNQQDSLRYSRYGISRLLEKTGFKILDVVVKKPLEQMKLQLWFDSESKVSRFPDEIGHLITCEKI